MKKFLVKISITALLFSASIFAQSLTPAFSAPSYQTTAGYNAVYTASMTDSTGTYYSPAFSLSGFLPQDIVTNYIPCYVVGSGTADSVGIFIQTRMKTAESTYSTWTIVDTVKMGFNLVDGLAHFDSVDFNGGHPDQFRFQVSGLSTVNRSDVVITAIAVLTRQLPESVFQVK